FRQVNLGKLLMKSTRVAAKNGLTVPSELMLFFKSIVTVEGMGRLVVEDFDVLAYALEFAQDIVKVKYDPEKVTKDLYALARDSTSLLLTLPRQIKQLVRKMNNPKTAWKISISELDDLRESLESSSNLIFLGFVFSSLVLASAMTLQGTDVNVFAGLPVPTVVFGGLAFITGVIAFFNYIKK
ncbi:MAG: AarF/ABC1/UbiB kinase family protein, partial [Bdellovibrionales bacterium]|nr:AarF/ABC1/UbiB kinase family protein [Bdellovibrionales bacterium]